MKDFGMPSEKTMDLLVQHLYMTAVPKIKQKLKEEEKHKKEQKKKRPSE